MTPYKIVLSDHMKNQKIEETNMIFSSWQDAYIFGIGKYGSGSYNIFYRGDPIGWSVQVV